MMFGSNHMCCCCCCCLQPSSTSPHQQFHVAGTPLLVAQNVLKDRAQDGAMAIVPGWMISASAHCPTWFHVAGTTLRVAPVVLKDRAKHGAMAIVPGWRIAASTHWHQPRHRRKHPLRLPRACAGMRLWVITVPVRVPVMPYIHTYLLFYFSLSAVHLQFFSPFPFPSFYFVSNNFDVVGGGEGNRISDKDHAIIGGTCSCSCLCCVDDIDIFFCLLLSAYAHPHVILSPSFLYYIPTTNDCIIGGHVNINQAQKSVIAGGRNNMFMV